MTIIFSICESVGMAFTAAFATEKGKNELVIQKNSLQYSYKEGENYNDKSLHKRDSM